MSTVPAAAAEQGSSTRELDLGELGRALLRHWRLVGAGAGAGVLLAGVVTLLQKPVWEGEFQIVLAKDKQRSGIGALLAQSPELASLAGVSAGEGSNNQKTEVKILGSPSVLLPVFEWVRTQKPSQVAERLRFKTWIKSAVEIDSERGTSVLTVRYRDTDKQLVLPTTRRISEAYQAYSGRQRRRELAQVTRYLSAQIDQLRPRVLQSSRLAQDYASAQGLGVIDGLPVSGTLKASGGSLGLQTSIGNSLSVGGNQTVSIETRRTLARQRIIALEQQLNLARAAGSELLYIAAESSARTDKGSTFDALTVIEAQLAEKRSRLRPSDPLVQRLERQRAALIGYINRQTIALLQGELAVARSEYNALERPKAVIQRHRELTQAALRDEGTLVELENNLAKFRLEQARETDPWDLISTPTLSDAPVAPRPRRNLALGLLAGLVLGSGGALLADRRTGVVYSIDALRQLLPYPLLACLDGARSASWETSLQLLAQGPLAHAVQVALITPVDHPLARDLEQQLQQALHKADPAAQVLLSNDLTVAGRCGAQVLLVALGYAQREVLSRLQENLQLQGRPVAGLLVIKDAA